MAREGQGRSRLCDLVDEVVARHVIARIEAVEIEPHASEFLGTETTSGFSASSASRRRRLFSSSIALMLRHDSSAGLSAASITPMWMPFGPDHPSIPIGVSVA
jgi:hypothetical protein